MDDKNKHPESDKKGITDNKGKVKKLVGLSIAIIVLIGGIVIFQINKTQQQFDQRRQATEQQRETLIKFYQDQGMTTEEINEKIADEFGNSTRSGEFQPNLLQQMMRGFRSLTGGTPGDGTGPRNGLGGQGSHN